ncbi:MAG: hypothetical protein ACFB00_04225 [Parvularculaceae bacterium]
MAQHKRLIAATAAALGLAAAPASASGWTYVKTADRLTNESFAIAEGAPVRRRGDDDFRVRFECRGGDDFVFALKTRGAPLGGRSFKIEYRIDAGDDRGFRLRPYANARDGGLNRYEAATLANELLLGNNVFVRVTGPGKESLEAEFSLRDAAGPIAKAAAACGYGLRP